MFEDVVDVLIYLYENYMDGDIPPPTDPNELKDELTQAGFSQGEVDKALLWLDELAERIGDTDQVPHAPHAIRVYTDDERARLDTAARGLLLFLEQNGILDPASRELVVERALALQTDSLSVEDLKWIVLLVLMNRPGREDAFTQMEDMVYNTTPDLLH
jgi:Smg protein